MQLFVTFLFACSCRVCDTREWVLKQIGRSIAEAQELGLEVCVGGEDASRADPDFLWCVVE